MGADVPRPTENVAVEVTENLESDGGEESECLSEDCVAILALLSALVGVGFEVSKMTS